MNKTIQTDKETIEANKNSKRTYKNIKKKTTIETNKNP